MKKNGQIYSNNSISIKTFSLNTKIKSKLNYNLMVHQMNNNNLV